jgi:hypothetical protein
MFRAGTALGVLLQGFSPPQSLRNLPDPVTFLMLDQTRNASSKLEATANGPHLQGFALCEDSTPSEKG